MQREDPADETSSYPAPIVHVYGPGQNPKRLDSTRVSFEIIDSFDLYNYIGETKYSDRIDWIRAAAERIIEAIEANLGPWKTEEVEFRVEARIDPSDGIPPAKAILTGVAQRRWPDAWLVTIKLSDGESILNVVMREQKASADYAH